MGESGGLRGRQPKHAAATAETKTTLQNFKRKQLKYFKHLWKHAK